MLISMLPDYGQVFTLKASLRTKIDIVSFLNRIYRQSWFQTEKKIEKIFFNVNVDTIRGLSKNHCIASNQIR